jgi:hypothetical protein
MEVWRNRGQQNENGRGVPRKIIPSDPQANLVKDCEVDGVFVLMDQDFAEEIRNRLGNFAHGPRNFFPANWPVSLGKHNINVLSENYVVRAKPQGPRYLLYIDEDGDIYMENNAQQIFRIDEEFVIRFPSTIGGYVKDTVLDGILAELKDFNEADEKKRFVFIIHDATRVNGVDITRKGILERMTFVKEEVMSNKAIAQRTIQTNREPFDIDVAEYKKIQDTEEIISRVNQGEYNFPFRSLVFHPKREGYISGNCSKILQWEMSHDQEFTFLLKIEKESGTEVGRLYVGGPKLQFILHDTVELTEELKQANNCIIEMKYVDHQWKFLRIREDRKHPNGIRALTEKMESLKNPVTTEMLLSYIEEKC